jgi:hypothetical protein
VCERRTSSEQHPQEGSHVMPSLAPRTVEGQDGIPKARNGTRKRKALLTFVAGNPV